MVRFEKALVLSKAQADRVQERRAMRGLAAAARIQSQFRAAIKHLERVLEISNGEGGEGEETGGRGWGFYVPRGFVLKRFVEWRKAPCVLLPVPSYLRPSRPLYFLSYQ